jgi:D-arabinose 1-dehydrogenase-like Zn-dependent alcohol dehydrogenase
MGVKFAHAFGAHVVVFTTSPGKKDDAIRLGANEVVLSRNADEMAKHAGTFDFILDAVAAPHDINAYINLLKPDGNITLVGAPEKPFPVSAFSLIFGRRSLSGSLIGGIAETQEMLDFCSQHRRRRSHPDSEDQRSLRENAQGRREIPVLDRYGLAQSRVTVDEPTKKITPRGRHPVFHPVLI